MSSRARSLTLVSVGVAALVVLADQLSKTWAVRRLSGGRTVDVVGSLRFNLTFNSGMAFSQGRGVGPFIGVVALGDRGAAGVAAAHGLDAVGRRHRPRDRRRHRQRVRSLFRAGDGFLGGAVIDFIDLQWWPIFNVADMAVTVGGVILVLLAGRTEPAVDQSDERAGP